MELGPKKQTEFEYVRMERRVRCGGKRSFYEQRHRGWTREQSLSYRGILGKENGSIWIKCRVRTYHEES